VRPLIRHFHPRSFGNQTVTTMIKTDETANIVRARTQLCGLPIWIASVIIHTARAHKY
jgi:hypothetical protein